MSKRTFLALLIVVFLLLPSIVFSEVAHVALVLQKRVWVAFVTTESGTIERTMENTLGLSIVKIINSLENDGWRLEHIDLDPRQSGDVVPPLTVLRRKGWSVISAHVYVWTEIKPSRTLAKGVTRPTGALWTTPKRANERFPDSPSAARS